MSKPRVILTVVCQAEGHVLAEVVADASGPLLVVPHIVVGVSPPEGKATHVDRRGVKYSTHLDKDESFEAACACGTEVDIQPSALRQAIANHQRRVALLPWAIRQ